MAAPRRNVLWDVQRLFLLAAKKEAPATCAMARIPADALAVLGGIITEYLRLPADSHLHPLTAYACKICHTALCKKCEARGKVCLCGCNNLRSEP